MPLLGMGTWGMGGKFERDKSNIQESITTLKYGLDLGINLIDVAEIYGAGLTEEIVGQAIEGYSRNNIILVSKVWKTNLKYNDVLQACEQSLARLKTDYIDYYLIHWPNEAIPLAETMEAMAYLRNKDLIRNIGVSNFSVELMKQAQEFLPNINLATNQIEYNLSQRSAEQDIIPYCIKKNIHIMAYRPLAKGKIPLQNNETINTLANKYNKTPVQIALNWIISQNITVIPKTSNINHLKENAGVLGWNLSEDDIKIISNYSKKSHI